jgi:3-hydroxybutyryl-CoA dehydratase
MTSREYRVRGLCFEDMQVGDTMLTPGRTITEADLVNFCGLSGDFNELHSNEEYAQRDRFGHRIAHGLLGLAVASGLAARLGFMEGTAQAFMGLEWKFKAPVFIGDTIHLCAKVTAKRELKRLSGGLVFIQAEIRNQREEVTQEGQWTLLMKSRASTS